MRTARKIILPVIQSRPHSWSVTAVPPMVWPKSPVSAPDSQFQ